MVCYKLISALGASVVRGEAQVFCLPATPELAHSLFIFIAISFRTASPLRSCQSRYKDHFSKRNVGHLLDLIFTISQRDHLSLHISHLVIPRPRLKIDIVRLSPSALLWRVLPRPSPLSSLQLLILHLRRKSLSYSTTVFIRPFSSASCPRGSIALRLPILYSVAELLYVVAHVSPYV